MVGEKWMGGGTWILGKGVSPLGMKPFTQLDSTCWTNNNNKKKLDKWAVQVSGYHHEVLPFLCYLHVCGFPDVQLKFGWMSKVNDKELSNRLLKKKNKKQTTLDWTKIGVALSKKIAKSVGTSSLWQQPSKERGKSVYWVWYQNHNFSITQTKWSISPN